MAFSCYLVDFNEYILFCDITKCYHVLKTPMTVNNRTFLSCNSFHIVDSFDVQNNNHSSRPFVSLIIDQTL